MVGVDKLIVEESILSVCFLMIFNILYVRIQINRNSYTFPAVVSSRHSPGDDNRTCLRQWCGVRA